MTYRWLQLKLSILAFGLLAIQGWWHSKTVLSSPPAVLEQLKFFEPVFFAGRSEVRDDLWYLALLQDLSLASVAEDVGHDLLRLAQAKAPIETLYLLGCFHTLRHHLSADRCEQFALLGMEAVPSSWRIPFFQGYVLMFHLNDTQRGSLFYKLAASRPGVPTQLADLARGLGSHVKIQDLYEPSLRALLAMPQFSSLQQELQRRKLWKPPKVKPLSR